MKYCSNPTNLASQLKTQKPLIYVKAGFPCKKKGRKNHKLIVSGESGLKFITEKKRSKELTDAVTYFIAKDRQPISVVQEPINYIMNKAHLNHTTKFHIARPSLKKNFPEHYIKMKSTVISAANKTIFFAITSNCLTSRATETYMELTFHTISYDQKHVHFTIQNNALPDKHTAETWQILC